MMQVRIFLPTEIFSEQENVSKVVAEGMEGYFTLLPRHIDYVSVLVPGILLLEFADGSELLFAVDQGTLVKRGPEVAISTRNAVRGKSMEQLATVVEEQFKQLDDQEKKARIILAGLEYNMLKRFSELKHP